MSPAPGSDLAVRAAAREALARSRAVLEQCPAVRRALVVLECADRAEVARELLFATLGGFGRVADELAAIIVTDRHARAAVAAARTEVAAALAADAHPLGRVIALLAAEGRAEEAAIFTACVGRPARACAALADLAAFTPAGELRLALEVAHAALAPLARAELRGTGREACALPGPYRYEVTDAA